jgi:hypothetical protein
MKGNYEENLNKALTVVLGWIESKNDEYTPNEEDMLDFPPHFEEEEDEEIPDDEEDDYDEEDES